MTHIKYQKQNYTYSEKLYIFISGRLIKHVLSVLKTIHIHFLQQNLNIPVIQLNS